MPMYLETRLKINDDTRSYKYNANNDYLNNEKRKNINTNILKAIDIIIFHLSPSKLSFITNNINNILTNTDVEDISVEDRVF